MLPGISKQAGRNWFGLIEFGLVSLVTTSSLLSNMLGGLLGTSYFASI
jgi:hypothetical protein